MNATTATVKSVAAPLTSALVRFVIVSVSMCAGSSSAHCSTRSAAFGALEPRSDDGEAVHLRDGLGELVAEPLGLPDGGGTHHEEQQA